MKTFDYSDLKKTEIFKAITSRLDKRESGKLAFETKIGRIEAYKTLHPETGISRTSYKVDGRNVSRASLMAMLIKKKQDGQTQAKQQLLLTQAQLDAKYKTKYFIDALEFMQFGKKKLRKEVIGKLKSSKKISGNDFINMCNGHYGIIIPTSDFFRMFEIADTHSKLLKPKK